MGFRGAAAEPILRLRQMKYVEDARFQEGFGSGWCATRGIVDTNTARGHEHPLEPLACTSAEAPAGKQLNPKAK